MSILEQVQADTRDGDEGRRARPRRRAADDRDALQQDAKLGDGDEVAVLQRERKKRLEAAEAYREGGSGTEQAAGALRRPS